MIRVITKKNGKSVKFSTPFKRVTRAKAKEQADRLKEINEDNKLRTITNTKPMKEDSLGIATALQELKQIEEGAQAQEIDISEVGPTKGNLLKDSQHVVREVLEEEARQLCPSLEESDSKDKDSENNRAAEIEDLKGLYDG